jgi:hypothetical protein
MSLVRLIVAWLLMAALPMQGMAAASMLFCGQGGGAVTGAASHGSHGAQPGHQSGDPAAHDHGHHAAAAAAHGHDGHGDVAHGPAAGAGHDDPDHASAGGDHSCPICASCCNIVALAEHPPLSFAPDAAAAQLPQPAAHILSRASPRPDKPPRA